MSPTAEKRLLQAAIVVVLLVPLAGSLQGVLRGPEALQPAADGVTLDSHYRYLSGLLLAMAVLFLSCVPDIERKRARMRLLAIFPITGGLARLFSLAVAGVPGTMHLAALGIELGVLPLLLLWQARVARRFV
jgi:hypothetical protein